MKIDVKGVLNDAWAMARTDGDLLFRILGLFFFLPQYALLLLMPPMPVLAVTPEMSEADQMALARTIVEWVSAYGWYYVAATLVVHFGSLVILLLYAQRDDLAGSLARALRLFPRYVLAMILIGLPLGLGVLTLVLLIPGLYVLGRMIAVGPALAAEQPLGVRRALGRSWRLTGGNGLLLAGLASLPIVGGALFAAPFSLMDKGLREGSANPIALALVNAGGAAVTAAALLAGILIQIAVYRRLVASNGI